MLHYYPVMGGDYGQYYVPTCSLHQTRDINKKTVDRQLRGQKSARMFCDLFLLQISLHLCIPAKNWLVLLRKPVTHARDVCLSSLILRHTLYCLRDSRSDFHFT